MGSLNQASDTLRGSDNEDALHEDQLPNTMDPGNQGGTQNPEPAALFPWNLECFGLPSCAGVASDDIDPPQNRVRLEETTANLDNQNWERLGARPKQSQSQYPLVEPSDGRADKFSARHSEDDAVHESLSRDGGHMSLFSEAPSQGLSYTDGGVFSASTADWSPLSDGIANDFLAKHSQDGAILKTLHRDGGQMSLLFSENPSQGPPYADGMLNTSCSHTANQYIEEYNQFNGANRNIYLQSGSDHSLLALEQYITDTRTCLERLVAERVGHEQRIAEAAVCLERLIREREKHEDRRIQSREQMIREQRERERREREERVMQEAERWPQQQEAITARSQWLCNHNQQHCRVHFPCCAKFYPCHRCHNNSGECHNEEAEACHATRFKCSCCHHEQEIGANSGKCCNCGRRMSAYFCFCCRHFSSVDDNPYRCEKCGICRIQKEKACEDQCCFCLEDAFSGCQILPCSHIVHQECAMTMIQNDIITCPVCHHPLYSPSWR